MFGLDQDVNNNICFLDEQTVLYPAGTQLVSYDIEHKAQRFINVNDGDGITALAVNSSASLIAVAVRGGSASTPHSRGADDVRAGKPTGIPTDGTARPSLMGRDTGTAPGRTVGTAANLESEAAILLYDLQNGRKKKALFAGEASARVSSALPPANDPYSSRQIHNVLVSRSVSGVHISSIFAGWKAYHRSDRRLRLVISCGTCKRS